MKTAPASYRSLGADNSFRVIKRKCADESKNGKEYPIWVHRKTFANSMFNQCYSTSLWKKLLITAAISRHVIEMPHFSSVCLKIGRPCKCLLCFGLFEVVANPISAIHTPGRTLGATSRLQMRGCAKPIDRASFADSKKVQVMSVRPLWISSSVTPQGRRLPSRASSITPQRRLRPCRPARFQSPSSRSRKPSDIGFAPRRRKARPEVRNGAPP
jgi:hypothetical protein